MKTGIENIKENVDSPQILFNKLASDDVPRRFIQPNEYGKRRGYGRAMEADALVEATVYVPTKQSRRTNGNKRFI